MKLNKQFYKEAFSKVEMSQEMKNKLMEIPNNTNNTQKKPAKKVTALLVAAAIVAGSAVSVFAGAKLYSFYTQKQGKYAESLVLEKNDAETDDYSVMTLSKNKNVKQPEFIKLEFSSLPEVFSEQPHTGKIVKFDYYDKNGITFDIIDVSDEDEVTLSKESVVDSEVTTLNGNSVYYFEQQPDPMFDDPFNKHIYMYISEFDYLIHGYVGGTVPKDIVYQVFENLTLTECEEWESHNISNWIEPEDEEDTNIIEDNSSLLYDPDINHYIQVGDTETIVDYSKSNIQVTVNSIEISDDLSMMDDSFKSQYLDENGKLKPLEVKCYGGGDGVNSLSELQATEYVDLVYVYETVTYKNTSNKDIKSFGIYHRIVCPPDERYLKKDSIRKLSKKYDKIAYDADFKYAIGEWAYDDFSKNNTNSPNYISIPANGEKTVHFGFFIPKDALENDLWISVYDGFTIENGRASEDAILVDIPQ